MTTRTKPFSPDAVKAGETKLIIDGYAHQHTYRDHDYSQVVAADGAGVLSIHFKDKVKIAAPPPRLIPHDMASFPRDGWFRWTNETSGCLFRAIRVRSSGIFMANSCGQIIDHDFDYLLRNSVQVHPDGTTSPCGREEGEGV